MLINLLGFPTNQSRQTIRQPCGFLFFGTHQPISLTTHQPINLSTYQPINPSTLFVYKFKVYKFIGKPNRSIPKNNPPTKRIIVFRGPSKNQKIKDFYFSGPINLSTYQPINSSTHQPNKLFYKIKKN